MTATIYGWADRLLMMTAVCMLLIVTGDLIYRVMKSADPAPPPVVEFIGVPETVVEEGQGIAVYYMRRNESCETQVNVRWLDIKRNAWLSDASTTLIAAQADLSEDFQPFRLSVRLPYGVAVSGYAPVIRPGPDCKNQTPVYPPMAVFRID